MHTQDTQPRMTVVEPLRNWMLQAVEAGASDLHIVVGYPPTLRIHGQLKPVGASALSAAEVRAAVAPLLPASKAAQFEETKNVDFSCSVPTTTGQHRFRVNCFLAAGEMAACFRVIPATVPDFSWAGFPLDLADRLAHFRNGLVIVAGVTGSGKTTSLAMIVNLLCQEGGYRVITVEEPVEYLFHKSPNSIVTQREVGEDVLTFADGLKYGLRQDPDVILLGEIRDRETGQMALSAAETGHLVLATMHTRDAKGAISRFADLFPQNVQHEVRAQLATALRAVISQHLLPSSIPGEKRELALEIMFNTSPIASAIRSGKLESIDNNILTGRSDGMITLNESVRRLFQAGKIDQETAEHFVTDKAALYR